MPKRQMSREEYYKYKHLWRVWYNLSWPNEFVMVNEVGMLEGIRHIKMEPGNIIPYRHE